MRTKRAFVAGCLVLGLAGCQTMHVLEHPTPSDISRLDRGAAVGVLLVDGTRHDLAVTEVSATQLKGTEKGRTVVVPLDAVVEIRHEKRATSARTGNALQRVLAAVAASLALATGDQDTVNAPAD